MKTLVVKNFRTNACAYTGFMLNFRNINSIEKISTHEVSGEQKYRITFLTARDSYDLRNLSEIEADRLMQRLLDFSRYNAKGETLIITTNPDKITIEET